MRHLAREFLPSWFLNLLILVPQARLLCLRLFTTLLIEYVSSTSHPKTMLCRRLVKFWESLRQCKKGSVRFLFNLVYDDRRTLTGRSVSKIAADCEVDRSKLDMRQASKVRYLPPPPGEMWRLPFLEELLEIRNGKAVV